MGGEVREGHGVGGWGGGEVCVETGGKARARAGDGHNKLRGVFVTQCQL